MGKLLGFSLLSLCGLIADAICLRFFASLAVAREARSYMGLVAL